MALSLCCQFGVERYIKQSQYEGVTPHNFTIHVHVININDSQFVHISHEYFNSFNKLQTKIHETYDCS